MADDEVLASLSPSPARRWLAIGLLAALGAVLIWVALSSAGASPVLRAFLAVLGIGAIVIADKMRRATMTWLEFTPEGLRDASGRVLCDTADIEAVEKGAFALKPSNGFSVRLKTRGAFAWEPGLWWRLGRRIGVGGVTPAAQGKFMADVIALHLKGESHLLRPGR